MRQFWLGVLVCGLAGGAVQAQADSDGLALQARAILRAHCRSCHGPGNNAKAGLNLEDRQLLVEKRRLILPGDAASSHLLDLVAGASMPPGNRPRVSPADVEVLRQWIDADAPQPPRPGDDYVLRRIARDWQQGKIPAADKPGVRYLSLNHLLHSERTASQLEAARKELEQTLTELGRGPAKLVAIDPENSVFRVLLTDLGWDKQPFGEFSLASDDKRIGPGRMNLYDLVLLEYPYAFLAFSSPEFPTLAEMLRKAKSLRPIPYVRGDWLTAILTGTPLGAELAAAQVKRAAKLVEVPFYSGKVGLEEAAAELGWKNGLPALQKKLAEAGLKELGRGEAVTREVWERAFPNVVERLDLGKAIVPLDGLSVPNHRGTTPLRLRIDTSDEKAKPKNRFRLDDLMQVRVRSAQKAVVEVINTAVKGKIYPLLPPAELAANRPKKLPVDDDAYRVYDDPGTEKLTAFAVDFEDLPGGVASFPRGKLIRAEKVKGIRDRFVHDALYVLRDDNKDFDSPVASSLLKVTVGFEITKK